MDNYAKGLKVQRFGVQRFKVQDSRFSPAAGQKKRPV
jgi:hypothetical protein